MSDNQMNELKNLKKKVDFLKEQIHEEENDGENTHSDDEEDQDEDVEDIQPKKKNIKAQRAGVSAEVYGGWNKKGDFIPKVIPKSEETKAKLQTRLL